MNLPADPSSVSPAEPVKDDSFSEAPTYDPSLDSSTNYGVSRSMDQGPTIPYLRIFGEEEGCWEVLLSKPKITIGRSGRSDVHLPANSVSREHAMLLVSPDGKVAIKDTKSRGGLRVNGERVEVTLLAPMDTIQIERYVLQFRTDKRSPSPTDLPRTMGFSFLPSSMRYRYRPISRSPRKLFHPGDTIEIGKGGVLLPKFELSMDETCVELELTWPDSRHRAFLCEVMGEMPLEKQRLLCVKLHHVEQELYDQVLANSVRGKWQRPADFR